MACGLHTASSNGREKKGTDDTACGLYAASSNEGEEKEPMTQYVD